jgi:hypothetical protein
MALSFGTKCILSIVAEFLQTPKMLTRCTNPPAMAVFFCVFCFQYLHDPHNTNVSYALKKNISEKFWNCEKKVYICSIIIHTNLKL